MFYSKKVVIIFFKLFFLKIIKMVNENKKFNTIDGKTLSNLEELVEYLEEIDENTFNYHKPHFYEWIKNVFSPDLALKVKGVNTKEEFIEQIKTYLILKQINESLKERLEEEYRKILQTPEQERAYNKEELNIIKKRMLLNLEEVV